MTRLMQEQFDQLKTTDETRYKKLTSSDRCTVTLKTIKAYNDSRPKKNKPLTERFEGQLCFQISNDNGVNIVRSFSKESCDNLDIGSLNPRVSTSSKSPKGKQSYASATLNNGALSSNPSPYIEKPSLPTNESEERRLIKLFHQDCEKQIKATPIPPATPNFFYRFFAAIFAAIGDYFSSFCSLFSSDDDELHDESLTSKTWEDYTTDTDGFVTYQTTNAALAKPIHGIRPLHNGDNICFINASFQSLMNIPGLIPVLTSAHEAKIKKEQVRTQELQDQINAYNLVNSTPNDDVSKLQKQKDVLQKSIQASKTLIKACEAYKDDGKEPVRLNDLRGFSENFRSHSHEDAEELLGKIWDPVLEPLRNGVNAEGKPDAGCIPKDIDPVVLKTLGRFVPKISEEKQLEPPVDREHVDGVCRRRELRDKKDASPLPPNGLYKKQVVESSIPLAVPALKSNEKISLQTLVTTQLTMQPRQEQGPTVYYEHNGVIDDYEVTEERIVIESLAGTPPEFLTLQLKRFDQSINKNEAHITLPADNKLTLIVDGKDVNYEIHAVEMHQGHKVDVGHYFSYIKKESGWVEANDRHIASLKKLPESVEKEAYMIFLKRIS